MFISLSHEPVVYIFMIILSIANVLLSLLYSFSSQYRDDVFWLPQNMDFRGRVYPLPPHLTHIGEDNWIHVVHLDSNDHEHKKHTLT